jgi:hypothetical protein
MPRKGIRNKDKEEDFRRGRAIFHLHRVQTDSGAYPASHAMGLSPGVKRLRLEADNSPPSGANVKNTWSYTSTSNTSPWRGA